MNRVAVALALQLIAAGCRIGSTADAPDAAPFLASAAGDRDHDGLCDDSEAELVTNADAIDSDGDSWPDVVEVIANTDPHDPNSPSRDQVGYLMLDPGTLDFNVAMTADGNGEGASGQLLARNAFDRQARRASDYFRSLIATGAQPPDNVRGLQADAGRFSSISGSTRLSFRLQFAFMHDETLSCAAALPFDFAVKGDVGGSLGSERYLLIVTAKSPPLTPQDFCLPAACL